LWNHFYCTFFRSIVVISTPFLGAEFTHAISS
jgi:hypothetical protein